LGGDLGGTGVKRKGKKREKGGKTRETAALQGGTSGMVQDRGKKQKTKPPNESRSNVRTKVVFGGQGAKGGAKKWGTWSISTSKGARGEFGEVRKKGVERKNKKMGGGSGQQVF